MDDLQIKGFEPGDEEAAKKIPLELINKARKLILKFRKAGVNDRLIITTFAKCLVDGEDRFDTSYKNKIKK